MKAYMTNAELIQSEIDRQQENGSDKGKKLRSSKKKSTKSKGKAVKPADQSDSSELVSSRDDNDASKTVSCTSQEVDIFSDEIEDDEDDESVNSDFNAIFLLMNAPTIIKLRFVCSNRLKFTFLVTNQCFQTEVSCEARHKVLS